MIRDDYGMHEGNGAGWFFMMLLLLVLVGLAVALLVVTLRASGRPTGTATGLPSDADASDPEAERILRRRFAAGEIDEDEFRRRQAALAAHGGS